MRARLVFPALVALAALPAAACTALVSFDTMTVCDGGPCQDATRDDVVRPPRDSAPPDSLRGDVGEEAKDGVVPDAASCFARADGSVCGVGDPCHGPPICIDGVCAPQEKDSGTPCGFAMDGCHSVPVCTKGTCGPSTTLPDSTEWEAGNDNARCCGGKPVFTTTVDNCGVCDVKCSAGQSCTDVNGDHYFCTPCSVGSDCWSGCCSDTITSHCSPSDCTTGTCQAHVCPDGTSCITAMPIDFCSY